MIGKVKIADAFLHFGDWQRPAINRHVAFAQTPHEAETEQSTLRGIKRRWPRRSQNERIDIVQGAVDINIAARELRGEHRGTGLRGAGDQLINITIFRLAQEIERAFKIEIVRIL